VLRVAEDRLPPRYRSRLARYRYGPGVFKVDWALSDPIPWRAKECARAGTVHLGGSMAEIAAASAAAWRGRLEARPFVLLAQPTLFEPRRAPAGRHVAWADCHVPHGSDLDLTHAVEAQVERFAPGFRQTIPRPSHDDGRRPRTPQPQPGRRRHQRRLPGPAAALHPPGRQPQPVPDARARVYLCSSSTPPGGAVHGLCGYYAALTVLRDLE
jgi:phytoene dehydrogenase-like protein